MVGKTPFLKNFTKIQFIHKIKQLNIPWWVRKGPWISVLILGGFLFIVIFADVLASHSPIQVSLLNRLAPPGTEGFLLGTDSLGRDLFSRLLYGGRTSLLVAFLVLTLSGSVGLSVGILSGYLGGKIDVILMRLVDIFLSFPAILMAILFAVSMGPGLTTIVIAISITYWARFCRLIRADVLQIKEQDFVASAKVAGCSPFYIMLRHILPNVLDTFLVIMSLQIGMVIRLEATLSFLGAGVPPPTPTWGGMVGAGRDYFQTAPWLVLIPGACLVLVVYAFNSLGDWMRDIMDPKIRALLGK